MIRRGMSGRWGERSISLGLVRPRRDGRIEVLSPRLAELARVLLDLGLSMDEILEMGERVYEYQREVAEAFVTLFRQRVFEPFERAEDPEKSWAEVRQTLEELRPFAVDAVDVLFKLAMDEMAAQTIQDEIDRRMKGDESHDLQGMSPDPETGSPQNIEHIRYRLRRRPAPPRPEARRHPRHGGRRGG